jgi:hypothetical protein
MTPGDEDDVLHTLDPITKILSDLETSIDVLEHPFTKITASDGVVTF